MILEIEDPMIIRAGMNALLPDLLGALHPDNMLGHPQDRLIGKISGNQNAGTARQGTGSLLSKGGETVQRKGLLLQMSINRKEINSMIDKVSERIVTK